ncbi:hypothetical protein [Aeromonas salmonicida]|uniref:hypothetical protein n=1 Tax=Aeromonas salmonicida TaxID=645 RepID=UPI003D262A8E
MDMLQGTPSWVYLVFIIIMYYGLSSCFKHKETKQSILNTAIIFTIWSAYSLYINGYYTTSLITFGFGLIIGGFIALKLIKFQSVTLNELNNTLEVNGSPIMLFIYIIVFMANYAVGYQKAIASDGISNYISGMHLVSGFCLGVVLIKSKLLISIMEKELKLREQ